MIPRPAREPRATASRETWATVLIVLVAAIPRLWAAVIEQGIFWPEEIISTLEPAQRLAFGRGFLPAEFREGARSWVFPGVLAAIAKVPATLGVHSGLALVGVEKFAMATLSTAAVFWVMRLARAVSGVRAGLLAGLLAATCPALIAFGSRCMPETASAAILVYVALQLELGGRRRAVAAGALAAFTVFLSYPNALLALAFFLLIVARRRAEEAWSYLVGSGGITLLGGLLDWPIWGAPFRSASVFFRSALAAQRVATTHPHATALYFHDHLLTSIGLTYVALVLGLVLAWRRASGIIVIAVGFIVANSLLPDKAFSFITPVLPLAIAVGSCGLVRLFDGLRRGALPTLVFGLLSAVSMAWNTQALTRGSLGFGASAWPIWHSGEDYFRNIVAASRMPDLCGVVYLGNEPRWTGGYTYLHRDVPIFFDSRPDRLAAANYVVGPRTQVLPNGWVPVYLNGNDALFHRGGACSPPPSDWTLNLP